MYGKKVQIYEIDGQVQKIMQNDKELKFKKWKEKVFEPTKIVDVKEMEAFSTNSNRKPLKHHPWRQGNFLNKVGAGSS